MVAIGGYTVIADVGNTLLKLFRDNMTPEPVPNGEMIGLCSPADKGDYRLTLYLHRVEESGEFRSTVMQSSGLGKLKYPPLSINLYYLLTAYSTADLKSRAFDENRIFGRAMQVVYDHSILRGSFLLGTLAEKNEEIRIELINLPADEMTKIWNFPNLPYKLSLCYRVGPVNIDSMRIKETRRVMDVGINIKG